MVMEAGEADLATVLTRTRNEKGYVEGNFARDWPGSRCWKQYKPYMKKG